VKLIKIFALTGLLVTSVFAATRIQIIKVIKPDTIYTFKVDTTRKIVMDTITIQKTFNDTFYVVKLDTVKTKKIGK
jgi:hypothetical protein